MRNDVGVDKRTGEGVLWWFGHVERMEKDRNAEKVYVGGRASSSSAGRPRKRWIDTVKDCFGCQASKENGAG